MNDVIYFLLGLAAFTIGMGIYGWLDERKHVKQ
jgi:hypothetical protein